MQRRESESKRAVQTFQSSRERAFLAAASSPTSWSSLCRDHRFRFDAIGHNTFDLPLDLFELLFQRLKSAIDLPV